MGQSSIHSHAVPARRCIEEMAHDRRSAMTTCSLPTRGAAGRQAVPEVALALRDLRASVEPTVVLSSLARTCVPSFSDGCAVELSEGLEPTFRVSYPLPGLEGLEVTDAGPGEEPWPTSAAARVLTTSFEVPSEYGSTSCAGVVVHSWLGRIPTSSDAIVARLLVDEAVALVRYERLAEIASQADDRSTRLALEAMTARAIGEATGIIMATRTLTDIDALDALKGEARHTARDIHAVALEVVHAGGLSGPSIDLFGRRDPTTPRATLRTVREPRRSGR